MASPSARPADRAPDHARARGAGLGGCATYRFYTEGTSAPDVLPGPIAGGSRPGPRAPRGDAGVRPRADGDDPRGVGRPALPDDVLLMVDPNCRPSITRDADAYRARIGRILARADLVKVSVDDLAFLRPGEDG